MADLVDQAFSLYLSRITPPASQLAAAQSGHSNLRSRLENDRYFGGLIEKTFLNGSYARHTVVRPIRDVDIIAVVSPDWIDDQPAQAMESLRRKLSQWYDGWRTRRRRRAVQVQLSRVDLDVLLAVSPEGDQKPMFIPDRELQRWIRTHPRRQLMLTDELSRRTAGNYPRLVRLTKAWAANRIAVANKPGSFVLECAVFHMVAGTPSRFEGPIDQAFASLLGVLHQWDFGRSDFLTWDPRVPDPALPDVNVAERWSSGAANNVKRCLELALRRYEGVERSRWQESAVARWAELFGGTFPTPGGVLQAR